MCGIYCYINPSSKINTKQQLDKIKHRGPDDTRIEVHQYDNVGTFSATESKTHTTVVFGFHRLSIVDTSSIANQPLHLNDLVLICNGEIYNANELEASEGFKRTSRSDCEVILHLFKKYKYTQTFEWMLNKLDGVYALVIFDKKNGLIYAARDSPIGVRPLFYKVNSDGSVGYASEAKALVGDGGDGEVKPVIPKTIHSFDFRLRSYLKIIFPNYVPRVFDSMALSVPKEPATMRIFNYLSDAVNKRMTTSDRPIGAFLSGGLDSTIIAFLASKMLKSGKRLRTFSIGFGDPKFCVSKDIEFAEKVAKDLNFDHTTIYFSWNQGRSVLQDVIHHLETFDTTTIRAGIPMYILSNYISQNTDIKVVLSGEGSDELFGGYLYFSKAPGPQLFVDECSRLLRELYMYDGLRADRATAAHGLELRVPFLDKNLRNFVETIDPGILMPEEGQQEKHLLRAAFSGLIPDYILKRQKDAFSDAVGLSWVDNLKAHTNEFVTDVDFKYRAEKYPNNTPKTKEAYYYRRIFEHYYPETLIRGYWMPKWSSDDLVDPSARELDNYCIN